MRIVVDLQGAQTESRFHGIGRYSAEFSLALARNPRHHDVWILLNGLLTESAHELRAAFAPYLAPERIVTFFPPEPLELHVADRRPRRTAAEKIRAHLIRSLDPSCLVVTSLIEPPGSEAVTSSAASDLDEITAAILYDLIPWLRPDLYLTDPTMRRYYEAKLDEIRNARLLLAISENSRREAIEHLPFPEARVANVSSAAGPMFSAAVHTNSQRLSALGITRPFVMYAPSGYDPRKNIEGLVESFAKLPRDLRQTHQLVVTSKFTPPQVDRLHHAARSHGLRSDELVLTGYVSDEDLIELYASTALFVYPSLHEGFGLPVLEAMSCGAPVIGSNCTSVPEIIDDPDALFDPSSRTEMTDKMAEALRDESFREHLRANAARRAPEFSWEESAGRALDAIESTFAPSTPVEVAGAVRPSLAVVTPLPPARSGIAYYVADLLRPLAELYNVTLIAEESSAELFDGIPVHDSAWFDAHAGDFAHVLYQFGNSEFHTFMLPLLRRHPGVVVLHDVFLSGLNWVSHATGRIPGAWSRGLEASHGDVERRVTEQEALQRTYPANREVLNSALGIIVHSTFARSVITEWFGTTPGLNIALVPPVCAAARSSSREDARAALGIGEDVRLVCTFGHLHETKGDLELVRAWLDSDAAKDPRSELHFVGGDPADAYAARLRSAIAKHPAGDRVTFTGWVPAATYDAYLDAADAAVQLRGDSRGETSRAVLDCLGHGLPTIVNAHGSAADLPDTVVRVIADPVVPTELTSTIDALLGEPATREALSVAGRAHVANEHSPAACAAAYRRAIESAYAARRRHPSALFDDLAEALALETPDVLAAAAQAAARSVRLPATPQQVLVDVTGTLDWPSNRRADEFVLSAPRHVRVRFVTIEPTLRGLALRHLDGHPGGTAGTWADVRNGDVLVIAAADRLLDANVRAVYRSAQSVGVRLAVPLPSSRPLVDAIQLLEPTDVGLFIVDQGLATMAERAADGVAVYRVDGPDPRVAGLRAILSTLAESPT